MCVAALHVDRWGWTWPDFTLVFFVPKPDCRTASIWWKPEIKFEPVLLLIPKFATKEVLDFSPLQVNFTTLHAMELCYAQDLIASLVMWRCGQWFTTTQIGDKTSHHTMHNYVWLCVCQHVDMLSVLSQSYHMTLENIGLFSSRRSITLTEIAPVMTTGCLGDVY